MSDETTERATALADAMLAVYEKRRSRLVPESAMTSVERMQRWGEFLAVAMRAQRREA